MSRHWKVRVRQATVDLIVYLWIVMPMRVKLWAAMNDGPLKGDPQ